MKTLKWTLAVGLSLNWIGCSSESSDQAMVADQGEELYEVSSDDLQASTGRIIYDDSYCNFFQTGPDIISTAYHCMIDDQGNLLNLSEVVLTYANGDVVEAAEIVRSLPKKDLIEIRLTESRETFLSTNNKDRLAEGETVKLVAYDEDLGELVTSDCQIDKYIDIAGVFVYDCPTKGHYSGSAVFYRSAVVGMHLGYRAKVDRRVAYGFNYLDNDNTDILEIEFNKEGCHTRAHIRGGVFNGHSRAHSRGCSPADTWNSIIGKKKKKAADTYAQTQKALDLVATDFLIHKSLQERLSKRYTEFETCVTDAKSARDRTKAENCVTSFQSQADGIIAEIQVQLEEIQKLEFDKLKAEARAKVDERHEISRGIVKTWNDFKSCVSSTSGLETKAKTKELRICMTTMREKFKTYRTQIEMLDVDIWDIL